jgi:hypothetical protein
LCPYKVNATALFFSTFNLKSTWKEGECNKHHTLETDQPKTRRKKKTTEIRRKGRGVSVFPLAQYQSLPGIFLAL